MWFLVANEYIDWALLGGRRRLYKKMADRWLSTVYCRNDVVNGECSASETIERFS